MKFSRNLLEPNNQENKRHLDHNRSMMTRMTTTLTISSKSNSKMTTVKKSTIGHADRIEETIREMMELEEVRIILKLKRIWIKVYKPYKRIGVISLNATNNAIRRTMWKLKKKMILKIIVMTYRTHNQDEEEETREMMMTITKSKYKKMNNPMCHKNSLEVTDVTRVVM